MSSVLLEQFDDKVFAHRDVPRAVGELATQMRVDQMTVARVLQRAGTAERRALPESLNRIARGERVGPRGQGTRRGKRGGGGR